MCVLINDCRACINIGQCSNCGGKNYVARFIKKMAFLKTSCTRADQELWSPSFITVSSIIFNFNRNLLLLLLYFHSNIEVGP